MLWSSRGEVLTHLWKVSRGNQLKGDFLNRSTVLRDRDWPGCQFSHVPVCVCVCVCIIIWEKEVFFGNQYYGMNVREITRYVWKNKQGTDQVF